MSNFKGLRTVIYKVGDLDAAKKWYADVLGRQPYFDEPFYVGFSVGGYELGLDPNTKNVTKGTGVEAYWGVDEISPAFNRLIELGAKKHSDIQDVGGGVKVATVFDPFGNVVGIIENPQFKLE